MTSQLLRLRPERWFVAVIVTLLGAMLIPVAVSPFAFGEPSGSATHLYQGLISWYDDTPILVSATVADDGRARAVERRVPEALGASVASSGGLEAPRVPVGSLDDASQAAFRAADNIDDFTVPLKHQPWASGNYARFAEGVDQQGLVAQALRSDGAMFLPNNRPGSFRIVYDFGQAIGTRGETALRVVVGNDGRTWTAFPVKP